MIRGTHLITALLTAILVVAGSDLAGKAGPMQDEVTVTADEKQQVQKFARQFVERFQKTRDVASLIPEFFLADFTSFWKQDFYDKVAPELYAKLNRRERVRLFVAQENLDYLITLDVMAQPDSIKSANDPPFTRILPDALARKLDRSPLIDGAAKFTSRRELLRELVNLEKAIRQARPLLKKQKLEQSPDFLKKISKFEKDRHLGYRVRASTIDADLKRELGFGRLAVGQKLFSVDTPILIELVLVNDGGKLRILTVVPADDH
jgi:hypothetical protein